MAEDIWDVYGDSQNGRGSTHYTNGEKPSSAKREGWAAP